MTYEENETEFEEKLCYMLYCIIKVIRIDILV